MSKPFSGPARSRGVKVTLFAVLLSGAWLTAIGPTGPARAATVTPAPEYNPATNSYDDEPGLTPDHVAGGSFGSVWTSPVNGQVLAGPAFSQDTMVVATETNNVYGLDAATGAPRWHRSDLGTAFNPATQIPAGSCGDISPSVGITSTPAVGPDGTVYTVAKVADDGTGSPGFFIHAMNPTTGTEQPGFPTKIAGAADNAPDISFSAANENQRAGLLIQNGEVFLAFGAHCDLPPYRGWVFGVSTSGKILARWVDETAPEPDASVEADDRPDGGIWQGGAPLVSDGGNGFFLTTGNGQFATAPTPGTTPPSALGESVVHMVVGSSGSLSAVDFYTPNYAAFLNSEDVDLGSGGLTLLPDSFGTSAHPHLAVVGGKSGDLWLLDRDHLNGFKEGSAATSYDSALSRLNVFPGIVFGKIAVSAVNGLIYARVGDQLRAFSISADSSGAPTLVQAGGDGGGAVTLAGSPVVTSSSGNPTTGLVWTEWEPNNSGTGSQLQAFSAAPDTSSGDGKLDLLWSGSIGTASKFQSPVVHDGVVYTAGRDGIVRAFGDPTSAAVTGLGGNVGETVVGASTGAQVTLTAQAAVTVTAMGITGQTGGNAFSLATPAPALPSTLAAGATLSVPVLFTPIQAGGAAASLTVTVNGNPVTVPLSGVGLWPHGHLQLDHGPGVDSTLALGVYPLTTPPSPVLTTTVTLDNDGATPLVLKYVAPPTSPYVAAVPPPGYTLEPGQHIAETLTFQAAIAGEYDDTYVIEWAGKAQNSDSSAELAPSTTTVALQAQAATAAEVAEPPPVDFGTVTLGESVTRSFTLTNTGGIVALVAKSKPPTAAGLSGLDAVPEGSVIPAGGSVTVPVTWTPTSVGLLSGDWLINTGQGVMNVLFSGTAVAPVPPMGAESPSTPLVPTVPVVPVSPLPVIAPAPHVIPLSGPASGHGWRLTGQLRHTSSGYVLSAGTKLVSADGVNGVLANLAVVVPDGDSLMLTVRGSAVTVHRSGQRITVSIASGGRVRDRWTLGAPSGERIALTVSLAHGRLTASVGGHRMPGVAVAARGAISLSVGGRQPVVVFQRSWSGSAIAPT